MTFNKRAVEESDRETDLCVTLTATATFRVNLTNNALRYYRKLDERKRRNDGSGLIGHDRIAYEALLKSIAGRPHAHGREPGESPYAANDEPRYRRMLEIKTETEARGEKFQKATAAKIVADEEGIADRDPTGDEYDRVVDRLRRGWARWHKARSVV